jgi:hypothetical protein
MSLEKLRRRSKSLLGGKYQAEVGAAIADASDSVWNGGLRESLGKGAPPKGKISIELDRLTEARLLVSDEENPYDRRKLLKPADPNGAYWSFCLELRRASA